MSEEDLKKECKEMGISVPEAATKQQLIALIEAKGKADDKAQKGAKDDGKGGLKDMSEEDLKKECKEMGISVPEAATKQQLIALIEAKGKADDKAQNGNTTQDKSQEEHAEEHAVKRRRTMNPMLVR